MRRAYYPIFTVLVLFALAAPCLGQVWQETQVTNTAWLKWGPKLYGNNLFYSDARNGYGEIYNYNLTAHSTTRVLGGDGIDRSSLAIWNNNLVMDRYVSGQSDLYLYDPIGGERPITTAPGNQRSPDVYGSTTPTVVWEDHRSSVSQIYIWDEAHGERVLSASSYNQTVPKLWGEGANQRVVWQENDTNFTTPVIYSYTPSEGRRVIGFGWSPGVYENKVVYWDRAIYEWNGYENRLVPGHLWQWTSQGGTQALAEHPWTSAPPGTDMWGDLIVATGVAWDPAHGFTSYQGSHYVSGSPSIFENSVAWASYDYNVYLSQLTPEPSALTAFAFMLVLCGFAWHRHRRLNTQ